MKETVEDGSETSASHFMTTFLEKNNPPSESIAHFKSIPWLDTYISSPLYQPIPTFSRHLKKSGEDYFFSRTISTPSTIPHMLTLKLRDFVTPPATATGAKRIASDQGTGAHTQKIATPTNPDILVLITLGKSGLDGHPSTIHGGVTCAIMDETMGLLVMLHGNNVRGPGPRDSLYTANLNVSYRAPVPTPGEVMVKTWLVSRQGRKWYSKGQLLDKDGTLLAEADGLWVTARRDKI